jgi:hypothetical protein
MDLSFFEKIVTAAGPQVTTLFALVAANFLLGLGVAIKEKKFEWAKVANLYLSDIFPKIVGYIAVRVIVAFGALEWVGPELSVALGDGLLMAAWLAIVVSLGGDILAKLAALGISVIEKIPGV